MAETVTKTYTFSSKAWAAKDEANATVNWTGSDDAAQFNTSQIPNGAQITVAKNGLTVTSPTSFTNVTSVNVTYSSSNKAVGSIAVSVGETTISNQSVEKSKTRETLTYTANTPLTGNVIITNTCTTNSFAINSISVTYTTGGSTDPETPTVTAPSFSLDEGTYYTAQSLTLSTTVENGTIYYTTNGTNPSESSAVFSSAISITATTTVKAVVKDANGNFSDIVTKTYTILPSIANTAETAYTVTQIKAIIDEKTSAQLAAEKVYVRGTVSQVDNYSSTYKSITYWLDENAFEVYGGRGLNDVDFSNINDIRVGAEVVIYGNVKKFVNSSNTVYEFTANNYLVSYDATNAAKLTATITATYKTTLTAGLANDVYAVTYDGDGALSVTSSATNVATATISDGTVTVTPRAAGTTTIKISAPATENYLAAEKSYTLTVEANNAATLPFSFDGGVNDIASTTGMSQSGLGSDYSASPKLKFGDQGDNLIIHFSEAAKKVTYMLKGNGLSGSYAFDVMESADGITYTTVQSHNNIPSSATSYSNNLAAASRYVKFVYTTKANGNVALGKINIIAASAVENPQLTFENATYYFASDATDKAVAAISVKGSDGAITYSCESENLTINATSGAITCTTAGTYTITASIAATSDYEAATATCTVKIYEPIVGNSIIVAEADNKFYAMTNTLSSDFFTSQQIYKIGDDYVVTENLNDLLFYSATSENSVTIQNAAAKYVQATAAKKVGYADEEYAWKVAENGVLTAATASHGTLQYNTGSPRFTTYVSKVGQYATIVSLNNVKEGAELTLIAEDESGLWATFSSTSAVEFESNTKVYTVNVNGNSLVKTEITNKQVPANTGVLINYNNEDPDDKSVLYKKLASAVAIEGTNLLKAASVEMTGNYKFYKLAYNNYDEKTGLGFYYGAANGAAFAAKAGGAYLAVPTTMAPAHFLLEDEATAVENVETADVVKFIENGVLYIQKNGRVYNAMGQLVK